LIPLKNPYLSDEKISEIAHPRTVAPPSVGSSCNQAVDKRQRRLQVHSMGGGDFDLEPLYYKQNLYA